MLSLKQSCELANLHFDTSDENAEKNRLLCQRIEQKNLLVTIIDRTGFRFSDWREQGATKTIQEFACFLVTEGKRVGLKAFKKVISNIYSADWIERYVYDLRFWQVRDVKFINDQMSRIKWV